MSNSAAKLKEGVFFNGDVLSAKPKITIRASKSPCGTPSSTSPCLQSRQRQHLRLRDLPPRLDIVSILDAPHYAEEILERDLLPDGVVIRVEDNGVTVTQGGTEKERYTAGEGEEHRSDRRQSRQAVSERPAGKI
jgi:hypothetical protein